MKISPVLDLTNIGLLVTYNSKTSSLERIHDCTISINDGIITDISGANSSQKESIDCNGKLVTPGFVDAHTHPVFIDGRENEFMKRLTGVSYQEIAKEGNGSYIRANNTQAGLEHLFSEISKLEKKEIGTMIFTEYKDRFQLFIAFGVGST